jgi:hypothetical protein
MEYKTTMKYKTIIQDVVDNIESCEGLAEAKTSTLINNGKVISKNLEDSLNTIEAVENAKDEESYKAHKDASLITGVVSLPLISTQLLNYGLNLDEQSMIELTIKLVALMFTYRLSYMVKDHITLKAKSKEICGSYKAYIDEKNKFKKNSHDANKTMSDLSYIKKEKEKLNHYKERFYLYLEDKNFTSGKNLTEQLMKANHKVNKLTRKLSTIQPNNNEFIDFK